MTDKQRRFAEEYTVDLNATQAAIRAGYPKRSAKQVAHKLLTNADVQAHIAAFRAQASKRTGVELDRVIAELARIAFFDPRRLFDEHGELRAPKDWPDDVAAAIGQHEVSRKHDEEGEKIVSITTNKTRSWDKVSALVNLGRHLGGFQSPKEREATTPKGLTIESFDPGLLSDDELRAFRDLAQKAMAPKKRKKGPRQP